MADILIKNIGLPVDDAVLNLQIHSDGTVVEIYDGKSFSYEEAKAIELPEHGDLISKKALEVQISHAFHGDMFPDISAGLALNKVMNIITDAPVIVEATE